MLLNVSFHTLLKSSKEDVTLINESKGHLVISEGIPHTDGVCEPGVECLWVLNKSIKLKLRVSIRIVP